MEDPVTDLRPLGAATARALEAFAPERAAAIERTRQNFLHGSAPKAAARTWQWALVVAALALVALALSGLFRARTPLSFQVDARLGRTNDQISAFERPVLLSFSDGTALTLAASSRAHVVSL